MVEEYLSPEQHRAVQKFVQQGRGIAWWKMGEGKSRIGLATFALMQIKGLLVIVTRPIAFESWEDELVKLDLKWRVQRWKKGKEFYFFDKQADVLLVSHGALAGSWEELSDLSIKLIIFDELYLYGNPRSQRSVAAQRLSSATSYRCVGLSGTIMPSKDNLTIFGQSLVMGVSGLLARTITEFRSQYQKCCLLDFGRGQVRQFSNAPNSKKRILSRLSAFTDLHYPSDNLRSQHRKFTKITLTPYQQQLIKQLKNEYYTEISEGEGIVDLKTALELSVKIRQIANGWLRDSDGNLHNFPSPKMLALKASLEELLAEGERVIVWVYFKEDINYLSRNLKLAILQMSSEHKFDLDAWKSGDCPIVVATESSGISFNYFSQVAYAKFFSMGYSSLDLQQSMARTWRKDSEHETCHYEFFFGRGSLDEQIYKTALGSAQTEKDFIRSGAFLQWLQQT